MDAAKKKFTAEYGASSIKRLTGLDPVRKRPGMYIGSTGERGLHHLVWEVVGNSVDEAMTGHATSIGVRLLPSGGVEVSDDGRGIPVEPFDDTGTPTVDVVLTELQPEESSTVARTRSPVACMALASPSSMPCRRGSRSTSAATDTSGSRSTTAPCPTA